MDNDQIQAALRQNELGCIRYQRDQLTEAEQLFDGALKHSQEALGSTHPLTLRVAYNLGNVYYCQKRLVEAEKMYKRAMGNSEEDIGPMFTSPLDAAHSLGAL